MRLLRIGMAQVNCIVGDLDGNTNKIIDYIDRARALGVDLVAFPELAITGYPPEDLLLKPRFIRENQERLKTIAPRCRDITAVVGFVDSNQDIFNAAAIIHQGEVVAVHHKMYLPNYGVFDEDRYFQRGSQCAVCVINGIGLGVNICEDIWYPSGPTALQTAAEAEVIVNINASPYSTGKGRLRQKMLSTRAFDNVAIVAYVNLVGGQDELVFDGNSLLFDERGELVAQGHQFAEDLVVADVDVDGVGRVRLHDPRRRKEAIDGQKEVVRHVVSLEGPPHVPKPSLPPRDSQVYPMPAEVYHALVLGTRDYVRKNGFQKVVIGLSGGIDSSLVAVIAVDALGPDNVIGVSMPSRYSSVGSRRDAQIQTRNLSIPLMTIPIEKPFKAFLGTLAGAFRDTEPGVAEENLQARIRGNILMGLSNKFGWLVLTTGNKSELATGYSTLYGDMAGGFAVIKDVPKTLVYELARYRNAVAGTSIIPQPVIDKEPSAELRPNQRDVDTLPPYSLLDPILQAYVEEDMSYEELVARGYPPEVVHRVITMVDRNEYKRRQAAPGIKITPRAFGKDRRLPIVNHYRES
ncbi:MAG: NAD+ synthase [Chloroflexi bacterium]|nr:NAD+ synthase [Chloroflexota bacterium]